MKQNKEPKIPTLRDGDLASMKDVKFFVDIKKYGYVLRAQNKAEFKKLAFKLHTNMFSKNVSARIQAIFSKPVAE